MPLPVLPYSYISRLKKLGKTKLRILRIKKILQQIK